MAKNTSLLCMSIITLLLWGCNDVSGNQELMRAEQLMNEHPDSALVLLQSIDTLILKSPADKALYSLLYVQAQDKNYIDTQDAAQIQIAVNFFKDSSDEYHKMLSYYYLARINENAKIYSNAITNLLKAENIAEDTDNHLYSGLIYRSFSDIYGNIYNNIESLNYAIKAYEQFKKSGREDYSDWALWDIGRAYHNCNDYSSSLQIAKDIINLGKTKNNNALEIDGMRLAGLSYLANNQFNESIDIYHSIMNEYPSIMNANDYRNLGLSYLGTGKIDSAEFYTNIVTKTDNTQQWLPYEFSKYIGDYKSALTALEEEHKFQDQILRTVANQNVTEAVSKYWDYEHIVREMELRHAKNSKVIAISVFIAIIILGTIIVSLQLKAQRREIENNMLIASNLRNMLQTKETEAISLQNSYNKELESKNAENIELQNAINNLFEQRFEIIDQFSSAYYEYQGTVNEKHKIYNDVMKLVSGLGSDKKTLNELENFVNTYKTNLMSRFREAFPNMKESDCVLYLYSVSGFSSRAISIFINEKLEVVYNRKSRLKQKISRSNVQDKDVFLQHIQ